MSGVQTRLVRGKLRYRVVDNILRDDVPCWHPACGSCPAAGALEAPSFAPAAPAAAPNWGQLQPSAAAASSSAAAAAAAPAAAAAAASSAAPVVSLLSASPRGNCYLLLDADVLAAQGDLIERGGAVVRDALVTTASLAWLRAAAPRRSAALLALLREPGRRLAAFAAEHHREACAAAAPRARGESEADCARRALHAAARWLARHYAQLGSGLLLVTEAAEAHAALAAAAGGGGPTIVTPRGLLAWAEAAEPELRSLHLAEMLAAAGGGGAAAAPAGGGGGGARALFRAHLPTASLERGLRERTLFQGTLRVNRDCVTEGRVYVYDVLSGRSDSAGGRAAAGSDDVVSVLISGARDMNRAVDGDVVVLQLLPRQRWRAPSRRLLDTAAQRREADEEDDGEGDGGEEAAAAAAAAAPAAGSVEDLRESLRQAAAAAAAAGGGGRGARARAAPAADGPLPTGRVVGIVRRNWRQYCGSLVDDESAAAAAAGADGGDDDGAATALFLPVDAKVPPILVETRQRASLAGQRIVVAIDRWDATSRYPSGHYVRTIGRAGERAAETEVILAEHDIAWRPFSPAVLACLPPADFAITPANAAGRVDLRSLDVCSVDPPGCKDIDDALHARWVAEGVLEAGVHIADVSYFVRDGSEIDAEAARRANTTYLVDKRLDMLPALLTETLCSLKSGVDRFAFSVTWQFRRGETADAWELVPGSTRCFKSIIHSRAALTYAKAQEFLDDASAEAAAHPVKQSIKLLASVARALRARRLADGALTLASPEVKFLLDSETAEPLDVGAYELRETNSMVEEWMLAANIAVARRTAEAYPRYALLRRHPAPPRRAFDPLLAAAAAVGATLDVSSSAALAASLDTAAAASAPHVGRLLRILATRCMMQATYFCAGDLPASERHHYGLAAAIYTHFTSPIRRYADVIVHRLLAAALDLEPLPPSYEDRVGMKRISDNLNRRHLHAQLAGRDSAALHTNVYFKRRVTVQQGLVMSVRENGVVVFVPKLGLEGSVALREPASGKPLRYDADAHVLQSAEQPALQLAVFAEVTVAILVRETARGHTELVYLIVDPPFHQRPAEEAAKASPAAAASGKKRARTADAAAEPPSVAPASTSLYSAVNSEP